ncbi:MAG: hypothetical protein H7333_03460 [Bdellovibrionales bacterium]|nr:hypothetical protein [Oligoflexia bacterium]
MTGPPSVNSSSLATPTPFAFGGNAMKEIRIPIILSINANNRIKGCAFDDGAGSTTGNCPIGSAMITTANGPECKKVLCDNGKFPIGTNSSGDVACCSVGQHFAGIVNGEPTCCGQGKFYSTTTSQCESITSLCNSPSMAKPHHTYYAEKFQSASDSDATCCRTVWAEDSGGSGTADLWCDDGNHSSLGYYLNSFGASCQASQKTLHGSALAGSRDSLPAGAHVDCNSTNGAEITASCCRQVRIPIVNFGAAPDCKVTMNDQHYKWDQNANGGAGDCVIDPPTCTALNPAEEYCTASKTCATTNTSCVSPEIDDGCGACVNPNGSGNSGTGCTQGDCYDDFTNAWAGCAAQGICAPGTH